MHIGNNEIYVSNYRQTTCMTMGASEFEESAWSEDTNGYMIVKAPTITADNQL